MSPSSAFLSSVKSKLPTTADFKYIDMYNTWYIVNIVLIIVIHIWVDHRMQKRRKQTRVEWEAVSTPPGARRSWEERKGAGDLLPLNGMQMVDMDETDCAVNRNAKIVIPILQLLFNIIFFTICMTGSRTS